MTNVKPTLPREVANAIESLRNEGRGNFMIMRQVYEAVFTEELLILKRYAFEGEHGGTPDILMSALINGYEVEQSPEDKLREYYADIIDMRERKRGIDPTLSLYYTEKAVSVRRTLNILGITIDGINA
ncbi:hypothetical protein [Niallia circulans]|uniref:hypothetical protein n=1 Tax=Niallia circulans TaxID=1397 RepID=UPI001560F6A3|nr:hypothetical protein [Niallia circulans]NRG33932.1 hypothetical protein [Niallia circulans]